MTAGEIERFRKIEAIFDAALELPPGPERDAFLRRQQAIDSGLYTEVRQLLEQHAEVTASVPAPPEPLPRFGPWQSVRLLGRGGMGEVYLAERADGAFQMAAAVKVAPLALASPEIEERFRRERQFLAGLDHPKVARLIDGGVAASGLPYLVMEFVDGLSIDRYCDARVLDARARIGLMRQVLEALIYVHGRGVIHRDLKPSNILVDNAGSAKLLDFGTARLVDVSGDDAITQTGVFAFTPDFASPEQAQGLPLAFASDIYSAGVLLYRLLTGRPPYRFADFSPGSMARTIGQTEPEPSGLDAPLDSILSKALRKKPQERYRLAAEMDADLARYLEGRPVRARRPKKLGRIALVVGALAFCAGTAIAFRFAIRPPAQQPPPSIAVLPFTNPSADQYFTDGLTDEITDSLARIRTLRVIARSSSFRFKGKKPDIREVGRLLHVANVLEGSVSRSGDHVKIVARLERVSDGSLLWSNTYERSAADLSVVQSELAAAVAGSLKVSAGVPSNVHVPTAEAREFYMKGRFDLQQVTPESITQAEVDFQHAIDEDPQYAQAFVGLASAKYDQAFARGNSNSTIDIKSVDRLLAKALELDPNYPAAHGMTAILALEYDWDWARAERELQLAVAGTPSAAADYDYAFFLLFRGRVRESDQYLARMLELDPFSAQTQSNLALARSLEGRYAESREIAQRAAAENPRMFWAQTTIGLSYVGEGHPDLALPIFRQLKQRFPPAQIYEAMAQAKAGRKQEALRLIRPYEEKYPNPGVTMSWLATVYAFMGDETNTLKWLQRSADLHEFQVLSMAVEPTLAPMRNSPGFRALEKRIGLLQ